MRVLARVLTTVILLTVVAAVSWGGFTAYQAVQVRADLEDTAAAFESALTALEAGDHRSARGDVRRAQSSAGRAADRTDGPAWGLATAAPEYGDDAAAVATVADVAEVLARRVLPPVVAAVAEVDAFESDVSGTAPEELAQSLARLAETVSDIVVARGELQRQEQRVAAIDVDGLDPRLARPVRQLQDRLAEASSVADEILRRAAEQGAPVG